MITQEFLSQCSDERIERGVAWLRFCGIVEPGDDWKDFIDLSDIPRYPNWPKYCASPNDIMPIAFANKFSIWPITRYTDTYRVSDLSGYNYVFNANPLRAICEVYILMSVNK